MLVRPDGRAIGRVGHLVDLQVGIVDASVLDALRRAADKYKILLVLGSPVQYLPTVFQPLPQKPLFVVPRRRYADQQFICVCLLRLFKEVILFWRFKRMDFLADREVAV